MSWRKTFITSVAVLFLAYCWAAYVYQNEVNVPRYFTVSVDLLGGKVPEVWERDSAYQFQWLNSLENKHYQPLQTQSIWLGNGKQLPTNAPISSKDFAELIKDRLENRQATLIELRDPAAIHSLVDKRYTLRNQVHGTQYKGGEPITKQMIDNLIEKDVKTIAVSGELPPVSLQMGTILMVGLIFLALVAALKPMVWTPFINLLVAREKLLDDGADLIRRNAQENARFEKERQTRLRSIKNDIQSIKSRKRQEALRNAGDIIRSARLEERRLKAQGLTEIHTAENEGKAHLMKQIPELAKEIADRVLGK